MLENGDVGLSFQTLSLSEKLTRITTIVSCMALFMSTLGFVAYSVHAFRDRMIEDLHTLAEILGSNSIGAIAFEDRDNAAGILASLRAKPYIVAGATYGSDGKILARYSRPERGSIAPETQGESGPRFVGEHLILFREIRDGKRVVGTIFLQSSLDELYDALQKIALLSIAILLISVGFAYLFALRLKKIITDPVDLLVTAARRVSDGHDFSIRVNKVGEDELGILTESFNEMLGEVESSHDALQEARNGLESRVRARTHDLELERDKAADADRAKTEFLANMSHEIRTPMTAILGFSDLLLDSSQSLNERAACIDTIRRNGQHLLTIINDILDISKIEAGKMVVERIATQPVEILCDVMSLMGGKAAEKNLQLKVEYDTPIPVEIQTDPTRLRQMLVNLVSNAIKFTSHGGVDVRLCMARAAGASHEILSFSIKDTGIGLDVGQVEAIFRPFEQADSSTTRRFGGTGLGLAITKRLAQMLGGDIVARSLKGVGSIFELSIDPGDLDGVERIDSPTQAMALVSEKKLSTEIEESIHVRVLLAEDGEDNQRLISLRLRQAGAHVTIAENGRKAYERALSAWHCGQAFNVILMDMQMPEMDGYSATARLRAMGYPGPIIALTAHAMGGDREKCLNAGCDDYTTKPIKLPELLGLIKQYGDPDSKGSSELGIGEQEGATSGEGRRDNNLGSAAAEPALAGAVAEADGLVSSLVNDRDLIPLVNRFVDNLEEQATSIDALAKACDWERLAHIAHQIAGAAGGYGFSLITDMARRVEHGIGGDKTDDELQSLSREFALICRRALRIPSDEA